MIKNIIVIIIVFAGYSILHSLFSGLRIKAFFRKYFPNYFSFYRITFNVIQFFLFVLLWIVIPKPSDIIYRVDGVIEWLFRALQILSLVGLGLALMEFKKSEFLGLSQIRRFFKDHNAERSDERYELAISGPYAICRHPLYLFTITLFLFEPVMTLFKLLFVIWLIIYFYIGSFYEERRLTSELGERYISYQKNVSRIFPAKWLKGLLRK
jgi:protein-S-isoprenylcysteine O-methyltransferase Ste14